MIDACMARPTTNAVEVGVNSKTSSNFLPGSMLPRGVMHLKLLSKWTREAELPCSHSNV